MKTTKTITTAILVIQLFVGLKLHNIENEIKEVNQNQKTIIQNDSITNARITDVNRKFYSTFSLITHEDNCKTVKDHINKTHTPNHLTCKHLKN